MKLRSMKKRSLLMAVVLSGLSVFSTPSFADEIVLGTPGYGGTGCPGGSASVTLSPDQTSLSILFDRFVAEAGRSVNRLIDRKSCNLAIPVRVPNGLSVSIFKVDYRGFTAIPTGAVGRFDVEYFFAGQRGPSYSKTFTGGTTQDYFLSNTLPAVAEVWSACGADVNLRINSGMFVRSNSRQDDTYASVDSVDVEAGIVYHLRFRRC